jgi:phosphoribosylaminoimidazolecarboxamide formyltransferase/IMP cyclohydrolase
MRALISVNIKDGITEFARKLEEMHFEIVTAGATYEILKKEGIQVLNVSEIIACDNSLDAIIKTLYSEVFAAVDADRYDDLHMSQLKKMQIVPFDMVVINIHQFDEDIHETTHLTLKNIDVGGVTLLKSACKNFEEIVIVCEPEDYDRVIQEMEGNGKVSIDTKKQLMKKAFNKLCDYDNMIRNYINEVI